MEQAYGADSKHIVTTPFTEADQSTNLIERWNGTLKDRLKPMRGMDRSSTNFQVILDGFVFYYNYLRPHSALDGRTPAEAAKADYPYKSWGDIVNSEMPDLEVTKEERDELEYNLKMKRIKQRTKKGGGNRPRPQTTLGGLR